MTPRIAAIPFDVERQSPMIDGAGVPWVAFQSDRGDTAHTKYCRIERRTATGWQHVPCPDAEAIYDQPAWAIHKDGTAVVIGMDRDKKHWIVADVPGFTAVPSTDAFTRLAAQFADMEARVTGLEGK